MSVLFWRFSHSEMAQPHSGVYVGHLVCVLFGVFLTRSKRNLTRRFIGDINGHNRGLSLWRFPHSELTQPHAEVGIGHVAVIVACASLPYSENLIQGHKVIVAPLF